MIKDSRVDTLFKSYNKQNKVYENIIFIDPGIGGTGWAFWKELNTHQKKPTILKSSGAFTPKGRKINWDGKVEMICAYNHPKFNSLDVKTVVIEFPEVWSGSVVSRTATDSGKLFKLVYLIGGIGEIVRRRNINLPILVTPKTWKGQLPKTVVIKRIKKIMPELITIANHEGDAIGMGLAAMGLL